MAKISELPSATTPLSGSDIIPVVQAGVTKQAPISGLPSSGGLTNLTEAKTTAAPNATVPVVSLSVTITETNGDVVLRAKGTGATLAHIPDNAIAGGNKRGARATDWQKLRSNGDQVASGLISVIAGGAYNVAAAEGAVVSGGQQNTVGNTFSTIAGGMGGTVSAPYAVLGGGSNNTIDSGSDWSVICGGISNRILGSSQYAIVLGGDGNTASGTHSIVLGGMQGATRGIYGAEARASGRFSAQGDAQRERFIKRRSTTSDTPSTLGTNGAAGGSTNQIILPNNSAFSLKGRVVARENATGDCAAWEFSGLIRRGANAAATALVAAITPTVVAADAGAAAWVVAVTADTTNGGVTITVTGEVSHAIRWVADIETVEVAG